MSTNPPINDRYDIFYTPFSTFQFMLQIQLSRLKLTKIVTIMPYFLVVNNTHHHLRYMEDDESADLWLNLGPHEVQHNLSFKSILLDDYLPFKIGKLSEMLRLGCLYFLAVNLKADSVIFFDTGFVLYNFFIIPLIHKLQKNDVSNFDALCSIDKNPIL